MTTFEDKLRTLRQRFIERAAADADAIETEAFAMRWAAVRDLSHSIVGRAGMFGFPALSDAAKRLEAAVEAGEEMGFLQMLSEGLVSDLRKLSFSATGTP